jgi:hypothetical protein
MWGHARTRERKPERKGEFDAAALPIFQDFKISRFQDRNSFNIMYLR